MLRISENSVLIIIVLYKTKLESCITYNTLIQNIKVSKLNYELIIYNNTASIDITSNSSYTAVNSKKNDRLQGAYNYALNYAKQNNREWLLLLDQDTALTSDYLLKLQNYLGSDNQADDVVAVVPFLMENSKVLSPHKIQFFNCKRAKVTTAGLQKGHVTAFNSLSLLKVDFLAKIEGFSSKFPLDMLDYWYYNQIYKNNKKVYVLDTFVNHQLSLSSYEKNIPLSRHIDLLLAEKELNKELGSIEYLLYKIRLLFRLTKHLIIIKNKKYAFVTFKTLLFKS